MCMYWLCESVYVFYSFPFYSNSNKAGSALQEAPVWAALKGSLVSLPKRTAALWSRQPSVHVYVCLAGQSEFSHLATAESVHSYHDLNPSKLNWPMHCPKDLERCTMATPWLNSLFPSFSCFPNHGECWVPHVSLLLKIQYNLLAHILNI